MVTVKVMVVLLMLLLLFEDVFYPFPDGSDELVKAVTYTHRRDEPRRAFCENDRAVDAGYGGARTDHVTIVDTADDGDFRGFHVT